MAKLIKGTFKFDATDSGYEEGEKFWKATTLYKAAEEQKCKLYTVDLMSRDLDFNIWRELNLIHLAEHINRVTNCSLEHPIILSPYGEILDGNHRVLKALCEGKTKLKAYRLKSMPKPDKE